MKTRGFTLIELLIVIAIIGILAAIVAAPKKDLLGPNPEYVPQPANYRNHECVAGYVVYKGKQIIDREGKGVPCN